MMKTRSDPRISAVRLGEYIISRPNQQAQILRAQKFPEDWRVIYYKDAEDAICRCIASGLVDLHGLERAIRVILQKPAEKENQAQRNRLNIEAIERFMELTPRIKFFDAEPILGSNHQESIMISNVRVSVRPEIILVGKNKKSDNIVGGIKLQFARTGPFNEDAAGYVSVVTQTYCDACLYNNGQSDHRLSFVIDLGAGRIYDGVSAVVRRRRDIEAACAQIFASWPHIAPP